MSHQFVQVGFLTSCSPVVLRPPKYTSRRYLTFEDWSYCAGTRQRNVAVGFSFAEVLICRVSKTCQPTLSCFHTIFRLFGFGFFLCRHIFMKILHFPYHNFVFLYSFADIPSVFLNTLEKCATSVKPTSSATSAILYAGSFRNSFA